MSDAPAVRGATPPPGGLAGTALTHNPASGVTGGIWRVERGGRRLVCKLLTPPTFRGPRDAAVPPWWSASDDPRHWNYWRRELLAYQDRLVDAWGEPELDMATLVDVVERDDGGVELWLEAVDGEPGAAFSTERTAAFAAALGRGQGRLATDGAPAEGSPPPAPRFDRPWLSHSFLATYPESKPVDEELFHDDRRWDHPLVRDTLGPLRPRLERLRDERSRFVALLDGLPQTLCHLDTWPHNLIGRPDGRTVLLDWAFAGRAALGEDVGNLVPDSVFDLLVPSSRLPALAAAVTEAYVGGVAESPWGGDERLALLGMRASAVKYHWLAPLMLAQADREEHPDYGGVGTVDPRVRYAERAAGLALLCDWADEARALAGRLGRW